MGDVSVDVRVVMRGEMLLLLLQECNGQQRTNQQSSAKSHKQTA
jgi:hypothetical protein